MAFKIGQLVQCIKKGEWTNTSDGKTGTFLGERDPSYGDVLTIREIATNGFLRFEEIVNPPCRFERGRFAEAAYRPDRFRPFVSTNIDVFKAILANPHKQLETVE